MGRLLNRLLEQSEAENLVLIIDSGDAPNLKAALKHIIRASLSKANQSEEHVDNHINMVRSWLLTQLTTLPNTLVRGRNRCPTI